MIPDPNDEILANKRRLAAKFDNDLHRIAEDIRSRQADGDREIVTLPPRRYEPKIAGVVTAIEKGRDTFDVYETLNDSTER